MLNAYGSSAAAHGHGRSILPSLTLTGTVHTCASCALTRPPPVPLQLRNLGAGFRCGRGRCLQSTGNILNSCKVRVKGGRGIVMHTIDCLNLSRPQLFPLRTPSVATSFHHVPFRPTWGGCNACLIWKRSPQIVWGWQSWRPFEPILVQWSLPRPCPPPPLTVAAAPSSSCAPSPPPGLRLLRIRALLLGKLRERGASQPMGAGAP